METNFLQARIHQAVCIKHEKPISIILTIKKHMETISKERAVAVNVAKQQGEYS